MKQVPSYEKTELFAKRSSYCIIIPVINEGDRIRRQLERMKPYSDKYDVIIADGGSTDDSLHLEVLRSGGVRTKLLKTGPGKLSAQMRMALDYAISEGYNGFVFIDGNNKDNPSAIPNFVEKLDQGFDHIQGSRFIQGGIHENTPLNRLLAIKLIHAPLISLASFFRYTDTTNGFRAYSRRFVIDDRVDVFRDIFSKYELHYYLAIRAARLGYKVIEIPVERIYPPTGKTPTKINGFKGQLLVMETLIKACIGCFNPERKI